MRPSREQQFYRGPKTAPQGPSCGLTALRANANVIASGWSGTPKHSGCDAELVDIAIKPAKNCQEPNRLNVQQFRDFALDEVHLPVTRFMGRHSALFAIVELTAGMDVPNDPFLVEQKRH
jgi:hypothetical protein